jgi:hypothetical protein
MGAPFACQYERACVVRSSCQTAKDTINMQKISALHTIKKTLDSMNATDARHHAAALVDGYNGMGLVSRVQIETFNRVITFGQICEAARVERDETTFWGDGFNDYLHHETSEASDRKFFGPYNEVSVEVRYEEFRAYLRYDMDGYRSDIIKLVGTDAEDYAYNEARESGASKQVAFEARAAEKQRRLEAIKDAYRNLEVCGIIIEFLGHHASVWGVEDREYAEFEGTVELAYDIVDKLEKEGFTVIGVPKWVTQPMPTEPRAKAVDGQNWNGVDSWSVEREKAGKRHIRRATRLKWRRYARNARKAGAAA